MAMACLRLFTFLPEPPERSVPLFISRIAPCTFLPAFLLERREPVFFERFLVAMARRYSNHRATCRAHDREAAHTDDRRLPNR